MRVMNEAAFREYFPDETLADKILHHSDIDTRFSTKGILNFGKTLFELDYGENGGENRNCKINVSAWRRWRQLRIWGRIRRNAETD